MEEYELDLGCGEEGNQGRKLPGVGTLTQGLEDAGGLLGGADGLEVRWQGRVVARAGQEALGLQAGAEHWLPLQVSQFLHGFQLDLEVLVLGRREEMRGYQNLD